MTLSIETCVLRETFGDEQAIKPLKAAGFDSVDYDGELTFEVFRFLEKIPADLLPDALCYAVAVGRHLIAKVEA